MKNIEEAVRQLAGQAEAIRALVQALPDEGTQWKSDPETWSMTEVMEHVYNEERLDFRKHLRAMFGYPPLPSERISVVDCREALEGFLSEREASIAWLGMLGSPDWEAAITLTFGPGEQFTLSAGDMLVSWAEHDFLHMRQMVELLHAWNVEQAPPYSVQYAGGW